MNNNFSEGMTSSHTLTGSYSTINLVGLKSAGLHREIDFGIKSVLLFPEFLYQKGFPTRIYHKWLGDKPCHYCRRDE
jgi:hypothetical protein